MSLALIEHIKKYVALEGDEVQILLTYLHPALVKKKDYLLKEGQVCQANYFVEKGCLRMFFIDDKGTEHTTQFAIEKWWISDYMSFGNQTPAGFYIQAVENSLIWPIDHPLQDRLFATLPKFESYLRIMMQKAYAASQQRIKYQHDFSREEQYRHFLSLFPDFVNRVPQYMLASYLGFSPEYLSEIRKKKS